MTKRLATLALIGAAAATFALPATPASADHCGTFHPVCPTIAVEPVCIPFYTFDICVVS